MIQSSTKNIKPFRLYLAIFLMLITPLTQKMEAKTSGSAQAEGPTEEFATGEAMRRKPKNAIIESTTCKTIDVGDDTRYRCTVMWRINNEE